MLPDVPLMFLAVAAGALPLAGFLLLGGLMFVQRAPSERAIARLTSAVFVLALAASLAVLAGVLRGPSRPLLIPLGQWFAVPGYHFELILLIDRLSAGFMVLITAIAGLIGRFSVTYMHRERGYARFFLLLHLFAAGMLLLVMGGSVDLLFAGWELVGITSVLLIAFFEERREPVHGGVRAFITYRACDVALLLAVVLMHHQAHTARLDLALDSAHVATGGPAALLAVLFVIGAMGKSAQFPVSGWLPRAMEGPTPSSALFYGALSVHAGVYLLLRTAPLLMAAPGARVLLVVVGLLSALVGTMVGRVQSDAKNTLAYATVAQVGMMFVEIGLGFTTLAFIHLIGHACVRTFQFLRAPSALHEAHLLHSAAGGAHLRTGAHIEGLLPDSLQRRLYGLSIVGFHMDAVLDRLARGVLALSRCLDGFDRRWAARLSGEPAPMPPPVATAVSEPGKPCNSDIVRMP